MVGWLLMESLDSTWDSARLNSSVLYTRSHPCRDVHGVVPSLLKPSSWCLIVRCRHTSLIIDRIRTNAHRDVAMTYMTLSDAGMLDVAKHEFLWHPVRSPARDSFSTEEPDLGSTRLFDVFALKDREGPGSVDHGTLHREGGEAHCRHPTNQPNDNIRHPSLGCLINNPLLLTRFYVSTKYVPVVTTFVLCNICTHTLDANTGVSSLHDLGKPEYIWTYDFISLCACLFHAICRCFHKLGLYRSD